MYYIKREFEISAGHRLKQHEGKCKNFHGHNYKVVVTLKNETLNEENMVLDFGDLKNIVKNVLEPFDHAMIITPEDEEKFQDFKTIIMYYNVQPTAEIMAKYFFHRIILQLQLARFDTLASVHSVEVWETSKSAAIYKED